MSIGIMLVVFGALGLIMILAMILKNLDITWKEVAFVLGFVILILIFTTIFSIGISMLGVLYYVK